MNAVNCSTCGAPRPLELCTTLDRPLCPQCGGTALTFAASVEEYISVSTACFGELIPGDQIRDWNQRWAQIQNDFQCLSAAYTDTMSRESIHAALQQLFSFFIHAYHLKDALKEAATSLGLNASDIEDAITNDSRLALLADLANLDKHFKLTKPLRSGFLPVIEKVSGFDNMEGNGWFLSVKIKHGTCNLDGLAVAKDVIIAWKEKLAAWSIL